MAQYENSIQHACVVEEGMVWICGNGEKPENFCDSAWDSIGSFVKILAGGGNFYDGWMKNPYSAMISGNDGFCPVSFYLEAVESLVEAFGEHLRANRTCLYGGVRRLYDEIIDGSPNEICLWAVTGGLVDLSAGWHTPVYIRMAVCWLAVCADADRRFDNAGKVP